MIDRWLPCGGLEKMRFNTTGKQTLVRHYSKMTDPDV